MPTTPRGTGGSWPDREGQRNRHGMSLEAGAKIPYPAAPPELWDFPQWAGETNQRVCRLMTPGPGSLSSRTGSIPRPPLRAERPPQPALAPRADGDDVHVHLRVEASPPQLSSRCRDLSAVDSGHPATMIRREKGQSHPVRDGRLSGAETLPSLEDGRRFLTTYRIRGVCMAPLVIGSFR